MNPLDHLPAASYWLVFQDFLAERKEKSDYTFADVERVYETAKWRTLDFLLIAHTLGVKL